MSSEPLSVLLVSANYRPSVGGIERFVEVLAEGLVTRGHTAEVLCCRSGGAPLVEHRNGVVIRRVRASTTPHRLLGVPWPLPSPLGLRRAAQAAVSRADIVHAQDAIYATTASAFRGARQKGIPAVLTQHVGFVPQGNLVLDAIERVAIATRGRTARRARVITTVSEDVAAWVERTWQVERPRTLPVGVEPPTATPDERHALRTELGAGGDDVVVLFAGRDVPKKRLDLFLGAADPSSYRLVAVTDRRGPVPDGVTLVPFMEPARFRKLVASCDVFVLPSYAEGLPLSLQEALAAGLACVITPHAGYERHIGPDDVVTVEPSTAAITQALRELASDPALRAELGRRARNVAQRSFGLDAFVDAYEDLYAALVE